MDDSGIDKEFEGAIDGGWRGLVAFLGELREDIVGADRLVGPPDDLQHPSPHWRQVESAPRTDLGCRADRLVYACGMIMGAGVGVRHGVRMHMP